MAIYIQGTGCACPDCGSDPCNPGCPCSFDEIATTDDGSTGIVSIDYAAGSNFILSHSVSISIDIDVGVLVFNLYADAVLVYTSGTIGAGITYGSATIPAGTTTITAEFNISTAIGPDTFATISC